MMYDYWGQGQSSNGGVWGFVLMLFMMAAIIVGTVIIVRYLARNSSQRQGGETALNLLEKRYAQGEIDTKEFEEKRKVLIG